jgi:TetR/AcrR family transcriptional repressor of nem operon
MKVSREQVTENRVNILEAARRLFAVHGFEAVTIAEVMKEAGLTHGGFYGHFRSKSDLIAQSCAHAVRLKPERLVKSLAEYAKSYLTPAHRDDRAGGCTFAATGSEAVRQSTETRGELTEGLRRLIEQLAETAPGEGQEDRRKTSITAFSTMVGSLILARLVNDPALSEAFLRAGQYDLARQLDIRG